MAWERDAKYNGKAPRRIGTSDIWLLPTKSEETARIRIPVPPSTNARMRPVYTWRAGLNGRAGMRLALTEGARGYLANAMALRLAWKAIMDRPLEDYTPFTFEFFLGNMAYDTHNGLKLGCDMIEQSGLILNDRFILPQVAMPVHAPSDPRLIIEFPLTGKQLSAP